MGVEIKTNKSSAPKRLVIAAAIAALFTGFTAPAFADFAEDLLNTLRAKGTISEDEYQVLLKKMRDERKADAMRDAKASEEVEKVSKAQATASSGVKLKWGGFLEAASIYRDVNEVSDQASVWIAKGFNTTAGNGIPYTAMPQSQQSEFRESARHSRVTMLATGNPDDKTALTGYLEFDFMGAAQTANSQSSNSYTPRLRQAFGMWENSDWGLHFAAGQMWSLATANKTGELPRSENVPVTIDVQYLPGFNFTRNPQLRLVKDWDKEFWLGLSLESPQTIIAGTVPSYLANNTAAITNGTTFTANPGVNTLVTYTGGSNFFNGNAYSTDYAPDVILKAAVDPGWGHYEVYGLYRWFRDRTNDLSSGPLATAASSSGINHTTTGAGIGGSVLLPVIPKMLDLQASFLHGHGVGRYGAAGLPDVTYNLDGTFAAIPKTDWLFGAILHPTPEWDVWGYYGKESVSQTTFISTGAGNPIIYGNTPGLGAAPAGLINPAITTFSGYGLPVLTNFGCIGSPSYTSTAANCEALTAATQQFTLGAFWRFYKGPYGTMQWGASWSHTKVSTFAGVAPGSSVAPDPDMNVYMLDFRYFPFQ